MSHVYVAHDETLQRRVALKVVAAADTDPVTLERARAEALVAASLDDARLVTVHDAFVERADSGDSTVIVMRFVEGDDLSDLVSRGPLAAHRVARIGSDVAAALAAVHAAGIVHRDVKPANIVVAGDPESAVLVDFGIARSDDTPPLTVTGTVIGTPAYLSPEQVRGAAVDGASDVYALGLVLLEALTGRREFEGTDVEAAIARVSRDPIIPPSLGSSWSTLLAAMTARDPAARPSALEVADDLREIATENPVALDQPTAAMPTPTLVMSPTMVGAIAGEASAANATPTARTEKLASAPAAPRPIETGGAAAGRRRRPVLLLAGAAAIVVAILLIAGISLAGRPADSGVAVVPTSAPTTTTAPVVATQPSSTPTPTTPAAPTKPTKPAKPGKGHGKKNG